MSSKIKQIEELIDRAANAHDSGDALRFSQAACNAANACSSMMMTWREFGGQHPGCIP